MVTSQRHEPVRTLAWLTVSGILLLAVNGHLGFVNVRVIGLILIIRGAVALWMNLGKERRTRYRSQLRASAANATRVAERATRAFESLTTNFARDDATRVPLADLLGSSRQPSRQR